ncbi:hypothetical protein A2837_00865 [Candidatus Kaiserbacteria bacterium RIFCSPHIGHO2_01_FULL_46_22]|uniref:Serine protease n=1 Tax=Candidatus Kaiserbacteria bacterium RIFCSPHIGHO2_01_FULL_46_22 TaxID=1798475 RepID=A0A1F6BY65_9BACT|nr:MAG: hypothetical protein A2837_00865 [Candidatus Kaiserbacteria bacterium RIFCSPHIGHO2_01_FULL_46_22]
MKNLLLGIIGSCAVVCITWYPATASAVISVQNESSRAVSVADEKKIQDATVNLYCRTKVGNKEVSSTGSGVLIDSRGIILTNAHVAQYFLLNGKDSKLTANCSVRTGSPAKTSYKAEVLYMPKSWLTENASKSTKEFSKSTGENDFAILYISDAEKGELPEQFPTLALGILVQLKKDDAATVAGYPAGSLKFNDVRNKLKFLSASTTITTTQSFQSGTVDLISLSPSKVASAGVSGGPVVSSSTVIGLATTMGTSKKKEGASLRAITVPYIDRVVRAETGLSLMSIYSTDLSNRAATTRAGLSAKMFTAIEKRLRATR